MKCVTRNGTKKTITSPLSWTIGKNTVTGSFSCLAQKTFFIHIGERLTGLHIGPANCILCDTLSLTDISNDLCSEPHDNIFNFFYK